MTAPVLIVGTGRCGSTLLSQMLREHPTVLSVSELFSFVSDFGLKIPRALERRRLDGETFWRLLSEPLPRQNLLLAHGLRMPEVTYPFERGRFEPGKLAPILQALTPHLAPADPDSLFDQLAAEVKRFPSQPLDDHYRSFFGWLRERFGKKTWAERSGGSLRAVHRLVDLFPEARVLHIVRDGRDTALSMSRHIGFRMAILCVQLVEFLGVDPFESDDREEEEDVPEDLAALVPERFSRESWERYELSPTFCAHYWSGEIATGLQTLDTLPRDRLLNVRYEDLLADPKNTTRRIGAFLDPEHPSDEWAERAAARVGRGRSAWTELPPRAQAELEEACAPGFAALAERGLTWA